jgi:hypothetical protein
LPEENLSLKGSIHFATMAADYNSKGKEIQKLVPLHLLPHYCFGAWSVTAASSTGYAISGFIAMIKGP